MIDLSNGSQNLRVDEVVAASFDKLSPQIFDLDEISSQTGQLAALDVYGGEMM